MYPPSASAKASIDVDGRGFIINGRRTYVASGSIHYARVPHELWRDRLLRLQRASFNCVQSYVFWNFQEPHENEFDFTGDKDFGAFLSTAQRVGLYATVRPGPYVCAEWDSGGYPIWLRFKPPMRVRVDDPRYMALNDHWYEKILPIVASHQIHRGGNVIMVQLENEHPNGWGVVHSPYFDHLQNKALELGIEVPHFMSGLHHGGNPYPDNPDSSKRTTPWYSTEFWSGWFDLYGPLGAKRFREVESDNWAIMARGGAGQNYYMAHGGTNFDTWNDPSGAASYDYGAAIGQCGDLRPIYFRMKRANQVAASFSDILADGSDASAEYADLVTGAQLTGARRSAAGTLLFLHNPGGTDAVAKLKNGGAITMDGYETCAIPRDATIAPGWKIADSAVRVLAVARDRDALTLVTYGRSGDSGDLTLACDKPMRLAEAGAASRADLADPLHPRVTLHFSTEKPDACVLTDGARRLRIVALSSDQALYTWLVGAAGTQSVVVGPEYISDFNEKGGAASMLIERPYGAPSCGQVIVYGAGATQHLAVTANPAVDTVLAPELGDWQMTLAREAAPNFDDSRWKVSDDPLQMGADGDISAFAWYRAVVDAPAAGNGTLHFVGENNLAAYVNGRAVKDAKHNGDHWDFDVPLTAGKNTIAVFTSHPGREKAFNYLGSLDNYYPKGLFGPATLEFNGANVPVKGWRMHGGVDWAISRNQPWTAPADAHGLPAAYRTNFRANRPSEFGAHPIYRVTYAGLTRGTVWLNGHNLGRYPEKIRITSLYLPECWLVDGPNSLTIFDETGASPAKVQLITETAASREIIRVDKPGDPNTPVVVPDQSNANEIARLNKGNLAFGRPATASSSEANNPPGGRDGRRPGEPLVRGKGRRGRMVEGRPWRAGERDVVRGHLGEAGAVVSVCARGFGRWAELVAIGRRQDSRAAVAGQPVTADPLEFRQPHDPVCAHHGDGGRSRRTCGRASASCACSTSNSPPKGRDGSPSHSLACTPRSQVATWEHTCPAS